MTQMALVIEDDLSLAEAINKKLQLSGFTTVAARSVDDALRLMAIKRPNFIWLDHYLLGDKDGIDFAHAIKANNDWKAVPLYVVSNTASNDKLAIYNELGVNRYYVKADHRLDEIIADIKADAKAE
jgi:DNA-binding response OmpR family regulator